VKSISRFGYLLLAAGQSVKLASRQNG